MDITHLKTFIEVANTRSFSRASEKLFITQPAISKRIKNLEEQLNCKLFDRIGHNIKLTSEGELLLPRAHNIVNDMENCLQEIKNLKTNVSGTLRLGISHYIGLLRIPSILHTFSEIYTDAELDINFYDSETAKEDILEGRIDIAVVTLPKTLGNEPNKDLEEITIWKDDLVFVTHPYHPLAKAKNVSLTALAEFPAILPDVKTYTGRLIENKFNRNNIQLKAQHPTNNLENIKVMVSTGFSKECWSILPKIMLDNDALKEIDVRDVNISRELGCLYSSKRVLSNTCEAFIALLKDETS